MSGQNHLAKICVAKQNLRFTREPTPEASPNSNATKREKGPKGR